MSKSKWMACEDCGKPKTTEKQQRAPRCHTCENTRRAKNTVYYACPECGKPKQDRGRSDRKLCNSCAAKTRWQSDSFRGKVQEAFANDSYRVDRIRKMIETNAKPEVKQRRSEAYRAGWDNERRKRHGETVKIIQRKRWADHFGFENWEDIPRAYSGFNEEVRETVRDRHGRKCAICGYAENGTKLDVHHIDYDKKHSSPDNLIALCHPCHTRTNRNRSLWQHLFSSYIQNVPPHMMAWVRAVL